MDFHENQPIYQQIIAWVHDKILKREWPEEQRIPSVRELAMQIGVNPNTVMRAYEKLQDEEVIYNKRGVGFFAASGAADSIRKEQRLHFLQEELPALFAKMDVLNVPLEEIIRYYEQFKSSSDENKQ